MTALDEIYQKIDIVELVRETSTVKLKRAGANWKGFCPFHENRNTPSLVVFPNTGTWRCFGACNEGGTIVGWMMKKNPGWDATEAVHYLAEKAHIQLRPDDQDLQARIGAVKKETAMKVAMDLFQKWLRDDKDALAYAHDRGWSDGILAVKGMVGFSGRATTAQFNAMRGEFSMHGIDPLSPEGVMILGYRGDAAAWGKAHGIDEPLDGDHIHGMMSTPGLVYGHKFEGRIEYMTRRQLPGFDRDGWKSWNPPAHLAGKRRPFFNHLHKIHYNKEREKGELFIMAEGQGDAVTSGMLDIPGMALCGAAWSGLIDDGTVEQIKQEYQHILYIADADKTGESIVRGKSQDNDFPLSAAFGPMLLVARMPKHEWKRPNGAKKKMKDLNDLAQWFADRKISKKYRALVLRGIIGQASPIVLEAAKVAGKQEGHYFLDMIKDVIKPLLLKMSLDELTIYKSRLAAALYPKETKTRATANLGKLLGEKTDKADKEKPLDFKYTFGGWFPVDEENKKGWLVDYLWNPQTQKARFCYRDPDGNIGQADHLDINNVRLLPRVDDNVRKGVVTFASDLGPEKPTRELLGIKEIFFKQSFLLDNPLDYKLDAYWSQFTWLYDCFDELAYLRAQGEPDSGKSAIMVRSGYVCYRLFKTSGVGSAASLKQLQHIYRGTVFFDEIKDNLDEFDDRVVMLNIGAMKEQAWATNVATIKMPDGTMDYEVVSYFLYGPKMVTMYGRFPQDATESRFLTFKTFKKELDELKRNNIPRRLDDDWRRRAELIRNMDMTWRLKNWQYRLQPPDELEDMRVSTRVNQVTVPIKYILTMDTTEEQQKEAINDVELVIRNLYEEQLFEKSQKTEARVVEAIWCLLHDADFMALNFVKACALDEWGANTKYIRYPDLAKVVNYIMDEMNQGTGKPPSSILEISDEDVTEKTIGDSGDGKKKKKAATSFVVTSNSIGKMCRHALRLPVHRMGRGYVVIVHSELQKDLVQERIELLRVRYGVDQVAIKAPKPQEPKQLAMGEKP